MPDSSAPPDGNPDPGTNVQGADRPTRARSGAAEQASQGESGADSPGTSASRAVKRVLDSSELSAARAASAILGQMRRLFVPRMRSSPTGLLDEIARLADRTSVSEVLVRYALSKQSVGFPTGLRDQLLRSAEFGRRGPVGRWGLTSGVSSPVRWMRRDGRSGWTSGSNSPARTRRPWSSNRRKRCPRSTVPLGG